MVFLFQVTSVNLHKPEGPTSPDKQDELGLALKTVTATSGTAITNAKKARNYQFANDLSDKRDKYIQAVSAKNPNQSVIQTSGHELASLFQKARELDYLTSKEYVTGLNAISNTLQKFGIHDSLEQFFQLAQLAAMVEPGTRMAELAQAHNAEKYRKEEDERARKKAGELVGLVAPDVAEARQRKREEAELQTVAAAPVTEPQVFAQQQITQEDALVDVKPLAELVGNVWEIWLRMPALLNRQIFATPF